MLIPLKTELPLLEVGALSAFVVGLSAVRGLTD